MSTSSNGNSGTTRDGDASSRSAATAYLAALRDDIVLERLRSAFVPITVATDIGPVDGLDAVSTCGRCALVGPPGCGKTTLLRASVGSIAEAAGAVPGALPVPVYVDLAEARPGDGADEVVARVLAAAAPRPLGAPELSASSLFLDNLDRVTDVYLLEGLELLLRAGGRAGPNVVLACRDAEWPALSAWFRDVPVMRVRPLAPTVVRQALRLQLPEAVAAAVEAWLALDGPLARAAQSPKTLMALCDAVRDRPPAEWRRAHVLDALLESVLSGLAGSERKAYRAALSDVALDSLGQGAMVEVDTVAMGLGVTRDAMIRTGAVVARGSALEFVEPLLAQHCAARRLVERAACEPRLLAERLGDLSDPRRSDTLVTVYSLAPDPVAFLLAILPLAGGPELAARCLAEPHAADPAGPAGARTVAQALVEQIEEVPPAVLYRVGEALVRSGHPDAAEVALRAAMEHSQDGAPEQAFGRPDIDGEPPIADWVRTFLRERNRGLAMRAGRSVDEAAAALGTAGGALERLGADLLCERGLAALDRGDAAAAIECLAEAASREPDRARYRFHHARALLAAGRDEEALAELDRSRQLAPDRAPVEAHAGLACRRLDRTEEALEHYRAACSLATPEPDWLESLGELQAETGDFETAAVSLGAAVALCPEQSAWQDALGQALAECGRWSEAATAFLEAHTLEPGRPDIGRRLGRARLVAGDAAGAVAVLRGVVEAAPADASSAALLGAALAGLGEWQSARRELTRAVELDAGWPGDHLLLARLAREAGDADGAVAHAQAAAELAPASLLVAAELDLARQAPSTTPSSLAVSPPGLGPAAVHGRTATGSVGAPAAPVGDRAAPARPGGWPELDGLGTRQETDSPVSGVLGVGANEARGSAADAAAIEALADLHESGGRVEEALAAWRQAASAARGPDAARCERRAAELCLSLGRTQDATAHLSRASALVPDDAELQHRLARLLSEAGDDERALGVLRRAARLAPDSAAVQADLAAAALSLGRVNEAGAAIEAALAIEPSSAEARALQGEIAASAGDSLLAITAYETAVRLAPDVPSYAVRLAHMQRPYNAKAAMTLLESTARRTGDVGALTQLAKFAEERGDWAEAAEHFARARLGGRDPDLAARHGRALRLAGRPEEALAELEGAWTPDTVAPRLLAELARAYEAVGRDRDALAAYEATCADSAAPVDASACVDWSRLARQAGDPESALGAARRAVASAPDSPEAHLELARAFGALGTLGGAMTAYRRAVELAVDGRALRLEQARVAADLGFYAEAVSTLEEGIADAPQDPELRFALGRVYAERGWTVEARSQLGLAVELAPDEPRYIAELARVTEDDDPHAAVAALERLTAASPDDVDAALRLGRLYDRTGRPEQALACFERGVELAPARADARRLLGQCLAALDRPGADAALRASLAIEPRDAATHAALGEWLEAHGRHPAALDAYAAATRLAPDTAAHWAALGRLRLARSDAAGAVEAWENAVRLGPGDASARVALGAALERMGRRSDAEVSYAEAVRVAGDAASTHTELARARLAAGDRWGAAEALERAVAIAPDDVDAREQLVEASLAAGRSDTAAHHARIVADARPGSLSAWIALATASRLAGDAAAAAEALDRALAIRPDDPALLAMRGEVALEADDAPRAIDALGRAVVAAPGDPELAVRLAEMVADDGWLVTQMIEAPGQGSGEDAVRSALAGLEALAEAVGPDAAGPEGAGSEAQRGDGIVAGEPEPKAPAAGGTGLGALAVEAARGEAAASATAGEAFDSAGAPERVDAPSVGRLLAARAARAEADLRRRLHQHHAALEAADRAVALADTPEHQLLLARCRFSLGDLSGAAEAVGLARAMGADGPEAHLLAARLYRAQGDDLSALAALEVAADRAPDVAELAADLGAAYAGQGRWPEALGAYRRAESLAEGRWSAELARAALEAGQLPMARSVLEAAAARAPHDAVLQHELGLALREGGDLAGAARALSVACRLAPANARLFAELGHVQRALGDLEAARASFRAAAERAPDEADYRLSLGDVALAMGDCDLAADLAREVLESAPDDVTAHELLGRAALEAGDVATARGEFEAAAARDPNNASARIGLGLAASKAGDAERAIEELEAAVMLDARSADTYLALGEVYAREGLIDDAIQAYQQAVVIEPHSLESHVRLGTLCSEAGLAQKAVAHLEKAVELAPSSVRAHRAVGQAYMRAERAPDAAAAYEAAIHGGLESPELLFDAGLAYKAMHDYGRAADLFGRVVQLTPGHGRAVAQLAAVRALQFLDRVTTEAEHG